MAATAGGDVVKTLARGLTYTLIAAAIAISLSVTWTTGLFWAVMACCAAAGIGIFIAKFIQAGRILDDFLEDVNDDHVQQQVARYHCAGHGCQLRTFYSDEGGTTWVCVNCERSYWVPVADVPYDQEAS